MTVKELYSKFLTLLPDSEMEDWDNDGLMCAPDGERQVRRVLISLDVTEEIVDYAIEWNFDLIISHHPLIFRPIKSVTEDDISGALYTKDSPELDLIVRTGGDMRISNFLLWQSAYAELYFTDVLWPDFGAADVDAAIEDFKKRKRRFGGV